MTSIRFTCRVVLAIGILLATNHVTAQEDAGPMVGHVDADSAHLLIRRGATQRVLRLRVMNDAGRTVHTENVTTEAEHDFVAKFHVAGLSPSTKYQYRISELVESREKSVADGAPFHFQTSSWKREGERVTVCFTSCVDIEKNPMWTDVMDLRPNMLCLMGDTPYIDTSDLKRVRTRHRSFLAMPGLSDVIRSVPTIGTWDDHDFGLNNGNGRNMKSGKGRTRKGFIEYRAHNQYGDGNEGVYHSADLGMIEVFLLDPRYFSQTEPSPVDASQPTCFGKQQWKWLRDKLKASKAPFKVLSMGAIWQDKKNGETDDMFTYWYERDALLDFVQKEKISGVVLLGGDIHVSRHLVHPMRVGYDVHDFVVSPGHERTITALDVYHPSLRWSLVEGQQFLSLTADGTKEVPTLVAKFRQGGGTVNREVTLKLPDMISKEDHGLWRGLRGYWPFDDDFANASRLGKRLDATETGNVAITKEGRKRGAVALERGRQQFLNIPNNPLDDNSDKHSYAMWFRANSLPAHGSADRLFLLESTAEGKPSDRAAYHLSLGLRASNEPEKINLQLYTHTLTPAPRPEAAPGRKSQGGFDFLVDRSAIKDWNHVACVFDSNQWTLFLNGQQAIIHRLRDAGPASEFGGLVIGGHRAGVGRNFDGLIDEVAIWSRALSDAEVKQLFQDGM